MDKSYRKDQPIRIFINNFLMLVFLIIPTSCFFAVLVFSFLPFIDEKVIGVSLGYMLLGWIIWIPVGSFWRYVIVNDWYLPESKLDSLWL